MATPNTARQSNFAAGNPVDFGADPTGIVDSTAAFTACLAKYGNIQYLRDATFKINGTVTIGSSQAMYLGRNTKLQRFSLANGGSASTAPVVHIKGGTGDDFVGAIVIGGIYESQNASPGGVIVVGHLDTTTSNYNARRSIFKDFRVYCRQAFASTDIGIYMPSSQPTFGDNASSYFHHIGPGEVVTAGIGISLTPISNGHYFSDIVFRNISAYGFKFVGAYGCTVHGGFMDTGVNGVIGIGLLNTTISPVPHHSDYNIINGYHVEPGGLASQGVEIGSSCVNNQIYMIANTGGGSTLGNLNNDINTGFQLTFRGGGFNGIAINSGGSFVVPITAITNQQGFTSYFVTNGTVAEGGTDNFVFVQITAPRYGCTVKITIKGESTAGLLGGGAEGTYVIDRYDATGSDVTVVSALPGSPANTPQGVTLASPTVAGNVVTFRVQGYDNPGTTTTYDYVASIAVMARSTSGYSVTF